MPLIEVSVTLAEVDRLSEHLKVGDTLELFRVPAGAVIFRTQDRIGARWNETPAEYLARVGK